MRSLSLHEVRGHEEVRDRDGDAAAQVQGGQGRVGDAAGHAARSDQDGGEGGEAFRA